MVRLLIAFVLTAAVQAGGAGSSPVEAASSSEPIRSTRSKSWAQEVYEAIEPSRSGALQARSDPGRPSGSGGTRPSEPDRGATASHAADPRGGQGGSASRGDQRGGGSEISSHGGDGRNGNASASNNGRGRAEAGDR